MFDSISFEYDLLNAIMTFNSHKRWKKNILNIAKKLKPKNALDIATGTADIAINLGSISNCEVFGVDISEQMLNVGRENITKMKLTGTTLQIKVWKYLKTIPKGQTRTYKQVAIAIKKPKAIRAVANAVGRNPYPIVIPCHRVIRSDGKLGGYSGPGGLKIKKKLLKKELKV